MSNTPHVHGSDCSDHGHAHAHEKGHAHGQGHTRAERHRDRRRLWGTLALTALIAVAEAVGGWAVNSLSLLSDAGHMLTDISAIGLSLVAMYFAGRPANGKKTYGYYRAEILSALANGVLLLAITGLILVEAYRRLQHPEPVQLLPAVIVAGIGLVANLIALKLLHQSHSMNMRGAFLHVLGDALSSVGVMVGIGVMWLTGWEAVDAVVSGALAVVIVFSAFRLVRDAVDVLLEAVPSHVDLAAVRDIMLRVSGVTAVHDLHVWTISSGMYALSAHLVVLDPVCNNDEILSAVKHELFDRFGIDHTTIQIESETYAHLGEVH